MKYIHLQTIDSTNNFALKNIENLDSDTVIFSDHQESGKGRNGRVWISPKVKKTKDHSINNLNLYCSILLKPNFNKEKKNINVLKNIAHYTAVVLCRTLEKYEIDSKIKWPNDILVDRKKIAGILCESVIKGNSFGIVVGCGVNLNMPKEFFKYIDQPATSLNLLIDKEVDRNKFLENFVEDFFSDYEKFAEQGFSFVYKEYRDKSLIFEDFFRERKVKINVFGETIEGFAKDIDIDGQLILIDNENIERIINVGDLFL
jgi:BirA family transcriptional regulator, biotin operon repressor / biotin---[acetyl-CoA-carboxylase] ligase